MYCGGSVQPKHRVNASEVLRIMYRLWGKRALDLCLTLPIVMLLSPILALVALAIKLTSAGPVFFRQTRSGYQGVPFSILKFRTMTDRKRTTHVELKGNNAEITAVGKVLRRLKIDEMPQLLNVLAGQMSLVGPRPDLPTSAADYTAAGKQRQLVRPGLTGMAQTHGNIYLSWPERWEYDAQYVQQLSLWLDLKLMLRTVLIVIFGEKRFLQQPSSTE